MDFYLTTSASTLPRFQITLEGVPLLNFLSFVDYLLSRATEIIRVNICCSDLKTNKMIFKLFLLHMRGYYI